MTKNLFTKNIFTESNKRIEIHKKYIIKPYKKWLFKASKSMQ